MLDLNPGTGSSNPVLSSGESDELRYVGDRPADFEPDLAEHAARYGDDLPVIDWVKRLVCSKCGGRTVDFMATGAPR